MRILITTPIFPPEIGGPATYVYEFARRASKLGHKIDIITLADSEVSDLSGVQIHKIPRGKSKISRELQLLAKILYVARGCNIIYAQNPTAIGLPSAIAAKLLRKPLVVKFVGDTAWEKAFREGKTEKLLDDFLKAPDANERLLDIERFVFSQASKIITPSNYLAGMLKNYHAVSPEKIAVIENAIDMGKIVPKKTALRKNRIITVARLVPWKGVYELIDAMPTINKKTGAELVIVGDGPQADELKKHAFGKEYVSFEGVLSHNDVLEKIADSRLFVLNSLYEGLPHVLLESLASATPIVATNICGNPEVVEDNFNGFLVPPKDTKALSSAILKILGDKKLEEKISEHALLSSKKYSWDTLIEKTIPILEQDIKSRLQYNLGITRD